MYEVEDKIDAIKNWADDDNNHWFDTSFVDSLADYLEEHGELTERQEDALDSIIEKNRIDVGAWK